MPKATEQSAIIDAARMEIKLGEYASASASVLSDPQILPKVQDYRRLTGSRMIPVDGDEIRQRIPQSAYFLSRKIDGEFTALVMRGSEVFSINPGGTVRVGLAWQQEAAEMLKQAGIESAILAGELYAHHSQRRSRVHDVTSIARQPQSQEELDRLQFAVFDIIEINGAEAPADYAAKWKQIEDWFTGGTRVHPVETKQVNDAEEIQKAFAKWVEKEDAEGLVVRSDVAGLFKVKPRHTLDVVVLGFTESTEDREGMLHDLLVGVMRGEQTYQVLARVGGGFSDQQRRDFLSDLKDKVVESEYAEVNSDHVAYQMVRPDWVIEISCLDLISQNTRGGPVNRMVLRFAEDGSPGFETVRRMPLAAVISPQFVRSREDKSALHHDVRIDQVSQRVEVAMVDRDTEQLTLPRSQVLRRDVYTKPAKGQTMVRKFVSWATNKESETEDFLGYVFHYTDFSPNRKAPLSREVRVSSSPDQILQLHESMIEANIKKGWELHSTSVAEQPIATDSVQEVAESPEKKSSVTEPKKKTVAKKKATKKKTTKKKVAKKKAVVATDTTDESQDVPVKMAKSKPTRKRSKKKTG
ncbi:MAG: RNA ligase family protein [Planctomycetota bacterium]